MIKETYAIKTFDKDYGDYLYVTDLDSCNLGQFGDDTMICENYEDVKRFREQLQKDFPEYEFEIDTVITKEANMKPYKEQIDMIETLFKEKIKVNEAVEIKFDSISILALKTKNGYEVTVYDNQTNTIKDRLQY